MLKVNRRDQRPETEREERRRIRLGVRGEERVECERREGQDIRRKGDKVFNEMATGRSRLPLR